jgi:hypothetical protein
LLREDTIAFLLIVLSPFAATTVTWNWLGENCRWRLVVVCNTTALPVTFPGRHSRAFSSENGHAPVHLFINRYGQLQSATLRYTSSRALKRADSYFGSGHQLHPPANRPHSYQRLRLGFNPQLVYTNSYNHVRRLRHRKLLYIEFSRSARSGVTAM